MAGVNVESVVDEEGTAFIVTDVRYRMRDRKLPRTLVHLFWATSLH